MRCRRGIPEVILNTGLMIILWIAVVLASFRALTALWTRVFGLNRTGDEIHRVSTEDGWILAMHRYRPKLRKYKNPVLLVHGVGANRYNFDLDDEISLARSMARRGFDTWCLELRGAGMSDRPSLFAGRHWGFGFDEHVRFDLPAAMQHLAVQSQGASPLVMGHSMGGMLALVHTGQRGERESPRALVLVSSPLKLDELKLARRLSWLLRLFCFLPAIYFRALGRFFAPFAGLWLGPFTRIFIQPSSGMSAARTRRAVVNLSENTSSGLMRQFLGWAHGAAFSSRDGQDDYRAAIDQVRCPVLILGGQKDPIAPPDSVAPVYQWLQSDDKQLRLLGDDAGDDVDFAHGDILLGDAAVEMVHKEMMTWFEARAEPWSASNRGGEGA